MLGLVHAKLSKIQLFLNLYLPYCRKFMMHGDHANKYLCYTKLTRIFHKLGLRTSNKANSSGENNVHLRSRTSRGSYKLKAFHEAKLTSKHKKDNEHDRFVAAGQTILPGTLFPSTKCFPIELSRSVWFLK